MGKQVDRKVWVTITDVLRFVTPILCALITAFSGYNVYMANHTDARSEKQEQAMQLHSDQLNDINIKLAVLIEDKANDKNQISSNTTNIEMMRATVNTIQLQVARLEREK